jgi:hypothetical protein
MRVLVATNELQGTRAGDYAWTVEGEIVVADVTSCGHPACGCGRGFPGLASSRATTTAMVADLPHIELDELREIIGDWLERAGWADLLDDPDDIAEVIDEHIENIDLICTNYAVGTVIERNGASVRPRGFAAAA